MTLKELREKRAKLVADAQEILKAATETMKPEDEQRFDALMAEADTLKTRIDREERAAAAAKELEQSANGERRSGKEDREAGAGGGEKDEKAYASAFKAYLRYGFGDLDGEQRQLLRAGFRADGEQRAQSTSTTAGGYLIPQGFVNRLESAMLAYGGMLGVSQILRTGEGNALPWPTTDDTSNEGALLAENTVDSEQDITFGQVTFNAYKYTTKIIRVSNELLQDSAINVENVIADRFAERLGRILNRHATTGTGSSQPNGVVTAATAGVTLASSSAITVDELINLEHSVNPAYRTNARWMFHDDVLKALKKLKDSENRPLWMMGYREGAPDTLMGRPYTINQHMATMEASAKSVLYGDFSKYVIRMVKDFTALRLVERYAEYHQVGFLGFMRFDGDLVDAGTHPIKYAIHPSP